ncbi:MAG: dockerin type I repeat-containing protein [Clostridia bacterium]|nr:dockerin type I repeat-containing protein [Clostridia bacterium]
MKKSTRIISILLAMVLCFGTFGVGASAAYADYTYPAGYDALDHPYVSAYQCGSMILDMIDEMLAEEDISGSLDIYIYPKITYDLTSVDRAFDTLIDIFESDLYKKGLDIIDMGDLERLTIAAVYKAPRRTTVGRTDLEMVYSLFEFLRDNKQYVGNIVDSCWDNGGIAANFLDINEMVGDVQGMIKEIAFNALYEDRIAEGKTVHCTINSSLDAMINEFIYTLLFDKEEGMLPDAEQILVDKGLMAAPGVTYFDIDSISVYELLDAVVDAALVLLKPTLAELFLDDEDDEILPIVISLLEIEVPEINEVTGLEFTREEKIDYIVTDLLNLETGALSKFILIDDTGIYLQPAFEELVGQLLQTAQGLISSLNLYPNIEVKSSEEIDAMSDAQKLAYMLRTVAVGMVDYAEIPEDVENGYEVATYFLINLMADKLPEIDYYAMIENGTLNPADKNAPLEVAADIAYYYLNSVTTMNIPQGLTFDETLQFAFSWVIGQFGGILRTNNLDLNTPATPENNVAWKNIDILLWENVFDITWLPDEYAAIYKDANGNFTGNVTKTILFDNIIYSVVNGDLSKLDDIFKPFRKYQGTIPGYPAKSEFDLSITDFVLNLVQRLLNGIMQSETALFAGMTVNCLNDLVSETQYGGRTNLRILAENLCTLLPVYGERLIMSVLPFLSESLVELDEANYSVLPPAGMTPYSAADLARLLEEQRPSNALSGDMMTDPEYHFFGSEDFRPLYKYYNYKEVREEASEALEDYERDTKLMEEDPTYVRKVTDEEINVHAYRLVYYYGRLSLRDASTKQLLLEINEAKALYGSGEYGSGTAIGSTGESTQYTMRTWNYYNDVLTFAESVYMEDLLDDQGLLRQSKVTAARELLVEAQKLLKKFGAAADYSYLDRQITLAFAKLEESLADADLYYPETIADLQAAYDIATAVDRGYDGDDQLIIDEAAVALEEAITGLVYMPQLAKVANTTTVLDDVNGVIFGVKERISNYISYVRVLGVGVMEVAKTPNGNGTGTVIGLNVNNEITESYTVIVYGDVDGDCRADGTDANIVRAYNAGFFPEGYLSKYAIRAADAYNDGTVDNLDAYYLLQAGKLAYTIDQRGRV